MTNTQSDLYARAANYVVDLRDRAHDEWMEAEDGSEKETYLTGYVDALNEAVRVIADVA